MLRTKITDHAKSLGFDLIGFTPAKVNAKSVKAFNTWIENNHEGNLAYMRKPRDNLDNILPNAKTVIALAVNYYHHQPTPNEDEGIIARYAYGRDYHKTITAWLKKLKTFIEQEAKNIGLKAYVDTGPVLERALAEQAGLGQIGKNACLITKKFGSWVFLAEVITTLDLYTAEEKNQANQETEDDQPFSWCGNCTKCIDACPTGAIIAPGVIDAKKCISYMTIEQKGEIPREHQKAIKDSKRVFGCDICQEVCPHNNRAKETTNPEFTKPIAGNLINFDTILAMDDEAFLKKFAGSPVMRAKRKGLQKTISTIQNI